MTRGAAAVTLGTWAQTPFPAKLRIRPSSWWARAALRGFRTGDAGAPGRVLEGSPRRARCCIGRDRPERGVGGSQRLRAGCLSLCPFLLFFRQSLMLATAIGLEKGPGTAADGGTAVPDTGGTRKGRGQVLREAGGPRCQRSAAERGPKAARWFCRAECPWPL